MKTRKVLWSYRVDTLDLRFRHGRHAASVCLRLGFDESFDASGVWDSVVDLSGGEMGVVVADDDDDDDKVECEE